MSVSEFAVLVGQATQDPVPTPDGTRDRILDAALAQSAAVGLDRMTIEDVVRRSKLSRMTVYRRFPRRDDLIQALRLREIQRFLQAVAAGIDRATATQSSDSITNRREGVSEAFIAAVTFAQNHPLLRRIAATDPGLPLATVAANDHEILRMGTAFLAREIHGQARGEPSQQVRWVADIFARLFITYLGAPPTDPAVDNETQMRRFADTVLAPMIDRAIKRSSE